MVHNAILFGCSGMWLFEFVWFHLKTATHAFKHEAACHGKRNMIRGFREFLQTLFGLTQQHPFTAIVHNVYYVRSAVKVFAWEQLHGYLCVCVEVIKTFDQFNFIVKSIEIGTRFITHSHTRTVIGIYEGTLQQSIYDRVIKCYGTWVMMFFEAALRWNAGTLYDLCQAYTSVSVSAAPRDRARSLWVFIGIGKMLHTCHTINNM